MVTGTAPAAAKVGQPASEGSEALRAGRVPTICHAFAVLDGVAVERRMWAHSGGHRHQRR